MKITVTGSLGHISKPLTETWVKRGHSVTVITSKAEREKDITAIGATAAIGTMKDAGFLAAAFNGADAVYLMEAVGLESFFDHTQDYVASIQHIADSYKQAIKQSGVKQVIHLSSIGAHMNKGNGILTSHYHAEHILGQLAGEVSIKFMRPVGFYYNMFGFIKTIKTQGTIVQNYGGDDKEPWVSPLDIAAVIVDEMEKPFRGREARYIASDEVSPNEVARALGEAIGKPDLKWDVISDQEFHDGLLAAGMTPKAARDYTDMNVSRRGGVLYEDYDRSKPIIGNVKLKDFARQFAAVYHQS